MAETTAIVPSSTTSAINDCWNKIGVQGDGSCPELAVHIHCNNCPVYTAAARAFLDRDLPGDHLAEWTRHFALEKTTAKKNTFSVVLFRLGAEWFALPVTAFREISDVKPIHSLPHRRDQTVLGLVNFRGELLVCVSLARLLNVDGAPPPPAPKAGPTRETTPRPFMMIVSNGSHRLVFPADEVAGIHRFNADDVKDVPATISGAQSNYTMGLLTWKDRSVGCLDAGVLFYSLNRSLA